MARGLPQPLTHHAAAVWRLRSLACWSLVAVLLLMVTAPTPRAWAQASPVKGAAALAVSNGFARMLIKLDEDVETDATVAGSVLVVRFKRPVEIDVGRLSDAAPDYVSSARRDPDGMAIRFALARKVKLNAMMAGERTFIDLLPETWTGMPPSLPQQVVRELAERARAAERALKQQRAAAEPRKRPPLRLRAAVQPTFVRLSVDLPDGIGVSSALIDQKLVLSFNAALAFDLADAKLAAPANVGAITQRSESDSSAIEIALIGDVDVRSFREDKTFIVDIGAQQPEKPMGPRPSALRPDAKIDVKPEMKPSASAMPREVPDERAEQPMPVPTSESIAQQASAGPLPAEAKPAEVKSVEAKPSEAKPAEVKPVEAKAPEAKAPEAKAVETKAVEAKAEPKPAAPAVIPAAAPATQAASPKQAAVVDARRGPEGLKVNLSFAAPTPLALFRRADVMWLVLDTDAAPDFSSLKREGGALIGDINAMKLPNGTAIRIRLNRPQLTSLSANDADGSGKTWSIIFADALQSAPQSLTLVRNVVDPNYAKATIPLVGAGHLHRIVDPDAGDALAVVTAPPPPRGFIRRQDFVEFAVLESVHGIVVQANADDVAIAIDPDGVVLSQPGGLTLSATVVGRERASLAAKPLFDLNEWQANEQAPFIARRDEMVSALAKANGPARTMLRNDLARFYFARSMYPEARGILNITIGETPDGDEDAPTLMMHAAASTLMNRPEQALKLLANPVLATSSDTQLWTGMALAGLGKWAQAREKFKNSGFAIASLPFELQRAVLMRAMRASVEVKDYAGASARSAELELVGIPSAIAPEVMVLRGRVAEALGREHDAMSYYADAMASDHTPAAAEARLLAFALRQKRQEVSPEDALRDLETLSATWRGDGIEVKTLQALAKFYADNNRYTEALGAARTATLLDGNSETSRQLQDDAAKIFSQMFLTSKGDDIPPIAALAAFYENSDLTPIGRKGDEMIRRLVERLVSVDLLDQAGELLQYQVDNRLEGAARAQVAARLAMIYLMNRKPERAIAALHATRIADLSGELRQQRILLEARAQSDIGRRDLALDIIANSAGREAIRLRSDIYWAARRWREASEQVELYYGDRWRDFKPLTATEKGDVIRAVIGYALAEDALGLARFREKYAPLMSGTTDRLAFDAASKPTSSSSAEFAQIAKMAAGVDTLDGFLRDMKARFPDVVARAPLPPETAKADPVTTGSLPQIIGLRRVEAKR